MHDSAQAIASAVGQVAAQREAEQESPDATLRAAEGDTPPEATQVESDQVAMSGSGEAASPADLYDQLRKLAPLRDDGILTEDEFQTQKARLLR